MKSKIFVALSVIVAFLAVIYLLPQSFFFGKPAHAKSETFNISATAKSEVKVLQKWELPDVLREVSGIAYLSENRFACVQDEQGIIFVYNTSKSAIEKEIPFAGPGDYEGLTVVEETAYVIRSDGRLYQVQNFESDEPLVREYENHLTAAYNIEGLCHDQQNNRLLIAIKDSEPGNKDYKGIYAFDLTSKKVSVNPIYQVDLNHGAFGKLKRKKRKSAINPSEIAIHPQSRNIYITDATKPAILRMDAGGNILDIYHIDKTIFRQPEGITFSPAGDLFISNEGKTGTANILQVQVTD